MSLGQLVEDVRLAVEGKAKVYLHGRPSGAIPTGEEVLEVIKKIMKN
jgi:2-oxoglutarate ferredoxin oxidoreductase subunit alpha